MVKLFCVIVMFVALYLPCYSQSKVCNTQTDYFETLIQTLDKSNVLRMALERGERGSGIHYLWMDEMKKLGIKQVSYVFNYQWENSDVSNITVKKVLYHPVYYQYDVFLTDEVKLKEIISSDLDETLKNEASRRAIDFLKAVIKRKNIPAKGTVYINLLDDDRLPIMVDLPEIIYAQ